MPSFLSKALNMGEESDREAIQMWLIGVRETRLDKRVVLVENRFEEIKLGPIPETLEKPWFLQVRLFGRIS